MKFDALTVAIIIVFFGAFIALLWAYFAEWDDEFNSFWDTLDWKDEIDDEIDERNQSGKK